MTNDALPDPDWQTPAWLAQYALRDGESWTAADCDGTRWPVPPRGRPRPSPPSRPRERVVATPDDRPRVIPANQRKADRWARLPAWLRGWW